MVDPVVHLFNGPYVVIGGSRREVPEGSKRLLVYVAMGGARIDRRVAANTLWPVGTEERAAGNLRSALWRLRGAGIELVEADKYALRLHPGTSVDLHAVCARAARVLAGAPDGDDLDLASWLVPEVELLPGWYEDWVVFERERLRQRLLHGLEALSQHLVRIGQCAAAIEAAMHVVGVDPLRESAQRVLLEAHLAEGNVVEARRSYEAYRVLAARELGAAPGAAMTALVRPGAPVALLRPPARRVSAGGR